MRSEITARQGNIGHCFFQNLEIRDPAQLLFRDRIQSLAQNHGLVRLWTQESDTFWTDHGFSEADDILRRKIPSEFGESTERWLTLQLRVESLGGLSLEQHFERFQHSQKENTRKALERTLVVRWFAGVAALVVLFALIWLAWKMVNHIMNPFTAPGP